jgi:hypothetical protein
MEDKDYSWGDSKIKDLLNFRGNSFFGDVYYAASAGLIHI